MAWWLFVVRPTTAGTLRAVTSCPARACRRLPIAMGRSSRGINHSIRTGPGGYLYTYRQEWAAPSYVYLKRCKADDGGVTAPVSNAACLLAYLPVSQPTTDMATFITSGNASTCKEDETHDLWLQWPFCMLLLGCFGSTDHLAGGAVFVQHDVYAHLHPALVQPHVARPVDHWARNPELWSLSTTSRQTSAWFMHKSHHYDVSIIHLVKNIWDKDPNDRTISLNATFIILFKNPSHMSQISHLDKQVYLSGNGLLRAA